MMLPLTEKERKTILVHARMIGDKLVNFHTGDGLPKLREGSMVDLYIHEVDFLDAKEVEVLAARHTEEFLPAGAVVFIALNHDSMDPAARKRLVEDGLSESSGIRRLGAFLDLKEPLMMHMSGMKKGHLFNVQCEIRGHENMKPVSLNHAYTLLSKEFETKRLSNGGNVFDVAYALRGNRWVRLKDLRDGVMSKQERAMMAKLGIEDVDARIDEILKR